jgi:dTDP-glucose 4,6-dehydratase
VRILITGTAGFVGSHILESVLKETDWDVVCIDSLKAWHNGNVLSTMQAMSASAFEKRSITHLTHDLSVPFRNQQIDAIGDVDYIANIASMSQVGASIKDPVGFIGNNVQLMLNMLELARELGPRRFIHMSTDEVYGSGVGCSPAEHQPSSPYAASKASQEDISLSYRRTFKVPVTIVNSSNMFGQRQSELAFIPKVVRWISDDARIPVHYYGDVPGGRHYTYVKNVTEHIVRLLRVDSLGESASPFPDRVHLAGQQYVDNHKLVERIGVLMNKAPYIITQRGEDARPGWDPRYAELAKNEDWNPTHSFGEGLISTVKWLESNL